MLFNLIKKILINNILFLEKANFILLKKYFLLQKIKLN